MYIVQYKVYNIYNIYYIILDSNSKLEESAPL